MDAPSYKDLKEKLSSMGCRLLIDTLHNLDERKVRLFFNYN